MVRKSRSGPPVSLGNTLIIVGVVLMAWPGVMWGYGHYAQQQLEREFDAEESHVIAGAPVPSAITLPQKSSVVSPITKSKKRQRPAGKALTQQANNLAYSTAKVKTTKLDDLFNKADEESRHVKTGHPLARLAIPSIDLQAVVVEGADDTELHKGPGHLSHSARPGEVGNCVIAGHRAYWFKHLPEVALGAPVYLETPLWRYQYVVDEKKTVAPDRSDLLNRNDDVNLTLVTCNKATADAPYRELVFCHLKDVSVR